MLVVREVQPFLELLLVVVEVALWAVMEHKEFLVMLREVEVRMAVVALMLFQKSVMLSIKPS